MSPDIDVAALKRGTLPNLETKFLRQLGEAGECLAMIVGQRTIFGGNLLSQVSLKVRRLDHAEEVIPDFRVR